VETKEQEIIIYLVGIPPFRVCQQEGFGARILEQIEILTFKAIKIIFQDLARRNKKGLYNISCPKRLIKFPYQNWHSI